MKNKRSIMVVLALIAIAWLPWLLARIFSRSRDIVCDGGVGRRSVVTTETAHKTEPLPPLTITPENKVVRVRTG
jgi:hypothetical protein